MTSNNVFFGRHKTDARSFAGYITQIFASVVAAHKVTLYSCHALIASG